MAGDGEWFGDEGFWEAMYPFMFPLERFDQAVADVESIVARSGREQGEVLDLCCGPGRFAVPLAERGFAVTGVDRSRFLLGKAQSYAEERGVELELVEEDMRRFVRSEAFDIALNLYSSFGYFEDPADNRRVLEQVYANLRLGGVFLLELMGTEVLARIFQAAGWQEVEAEGTLIQHRTVTKDWSFMDNEWLLVKGDAARRFRIRHWVYSGAELKALLHAAGFDTVELYGGLDGTPYGPEARRLLAVARKTSTGEHAMAS